MKSTGLSFGNFMIIKDLIFVLFFACLIFLISLFVFKSFKKMSLWIMVKGARLEVKNIIAGLFIILSCFIFGGAFIYSGALMFLAGLPIFIFTFLSLLSIIFMPIIFGGILAKYVFKKEDYINSKNILYGTLYLVMLLLLPYTIASILFFILFTYTFGICSTYFWNILVKNSSI